MQGYVASIIKIVLLIMHGILKRKKSIHRNVRNRVCEIADFRKTVNVNGQFMEIHKLEKKKKKKNPDFH